MYTGEAVWAYLEPAWNLLFWWLNPPKQGLFQSKQGSFGFQVYIYIERESLSVLLRVWNNIVKKKGAGLNTAYMEHQGDAFWVF